MLRPTRSVAPSALTIVTLAEAKQHCRVGDFTDDDALITALINTAESLLDGYSGTLGRALLNQSWALSFCSFYEGGCRKLRLPVGIASSVTSITYYDADNVSKTLDTSVYQLLTDEAGSYISLKPLQVWPSTYSREDAVTVTWVAGYGSTQTSVPAAIRQAMLMMIGHWFDNRESVLIGETATELPMAVRSLLAPFTRP